MVFHVFFTKSSGEIPSSPSPPDFACRPFNVTSRIRLPQRMRSFLQAPTAVECVLLACFLLIEMSCNKFHWVFDQAETIYHHAWKLVNLWLEHAPDKNNGIQEYPAHVHDWKSAQIRYMNWIYVTCLICVDPWLQLPFPVDMFWTVSHKPPSISASRIDNSISLVKLDAWYTYGCFQK